MARSGRRRTAVSMLLAAAIAVPVGVAVLHEGFPVVDPRLAVREVWVTDRSELLAGRLNRQIEELDAAVAASAEDVDVVQEDELAFLFSAETGIVERIDPATTTFSDRGELGAGAVPQLRAERIASVDAAGALRVQPAEQPLAELALAEPLAELGAGALAVVDVEGGVHAVSAERGELLSFAPGAQPGDEPRRRELAGALDDVELTAVGTVPVLLDRGAGELVLAERRVPLDATGSLRLQQPGPHHDAVLVAADGALLEVPLDGDGAVLRHETPGAAAAAAAPVRLDGCSHAAWADGAVYLVRCAGQPSTQRIPSDTRGGELVFRVNGDVIALNSTATGDVWLVDERMRLVDNWAEVVPPEQSDTAGEQRIASTQVFEDTLAERTEENRPPVARDDVLGARPGRATVLPVLQNDSDPDGDVLVAVDAELATELGRLDPVDGGRALQLTPAEGASGQLRIPYTADDGRGGTDAAEATVTIRQPSENAAPQQLRRTAVQVEQGGTIALDVLGDWIDPDGDDLVLLSASATGGDGVRASPEGRVTYTHRSGELGATAVELLVSDGRESTAGELLVEVLPAGSLAPVGVPDAVELLAGRTAVVEPLRNDLSPNGAPLRLTGVHDVPAALEAEVNGDLGTITIGASQPGAYYLGYDLAAGGAEGRGLVRVDVLPAPDDDAPPRPVRDIAQLRVGQPVELPVLANDVSPSGRVLAVRSIDASAAAGAVAVEVLGHSVVRLTATAQLVEPVSIDYTVSDGRAEASSSISLVPLGELVEQRPPIAADDVATVRAGDIVAVDVLANDRHPDGVAIELQDELGEIAGLGDGVAFLADGRLRVQAPSNAGTVTIGYGIVDRNGQTAVAAAVLTVVEGERSENRPPAPVALTTRVLAGSAVRIPVPLDGIDPDGDSAELLGASSAPALGRIVEQGASELVYEAGSAGTGTDEFEYRVRDPLGASGTARIRIAVVPPPESWPPPVAADDVVEVRPGRTAAIPVLANDSDPSGGRIELQQQLLEADPQLEAEVVGQHVHVRAPEQEGATLLLRYAIANDRGGRADAFVRVVVTAEARAVPPTAADQHVPAERVIGAERVDVPVLPGAFNPSGAVEELRIAVVGDAAGVEVLQQQGALRVPTSPERRVVAFTLTDPVDGLSATAFVVVPPRPADDAPPERFPPPRLAALPEQSVQQGGELRWRLDEVVVVPSGNPAVLVDPDGARAVGGDGSPVVVDGGLRFRPAEGYSGAAAVTFAVADARADAGDPANVALLTIPITVGATDAADAPPTVTGTTLEVEAAGEEARLDLRELTAHPNEAVLAAVAYAGPSGAAGDLTVALDGSVLRVSAPAGARAGAVAPLRFEARYAEHAVPFTVEVRVVSSSRPLTVTNDDLLELRRGGSGTVDVLANDVSGFPAGQPLEVIAAEAVNTADAAVRVVDGRSVRVIPGAGFVGTAEIRYTVADPTGDPAREVRGRLVVEVRDVPGWDGAAAPTVGGESDGAVTVAFPAASSNHSPITGYTIRWDGGSRDVAREGSHRIDGLVNGTAYRFSVVARNGVGASQTSAQSPAATPFGAPESPTNVRLAASADGSGSVTASWAWSGADRGSAVDRFRVRLADGTEVVASGRGARSAVLPWWVGESASATVTAIGRIESAASAASASVTPSPAPPASVVLEGHEWEDYGMVLRWTAGQNRARLPVRYEWTLDDRDGLSGTTEQLSESFRSVQPGVTITGSVRTLIGEARSTVVSDSDHIGTIYRPAPPAGLAVDDFSPSGDESLGFFMTAEASPDATGYPETQYEFCIAGDGYWSSANSSYNSATYYRSVSFSYEVWARVVVDGVRSEPVRYSYGPHGSGPVIDAYCGD